MRRPTGLYDRIVVDEAQCFMNGPSVMETLDLELGGNGILTRHDSRTDATVSAALETVLPSCAGMCEETHALPGLRRSDT